MHMHICLCYLRPVPLVSKEEELSELGRGVLLYSRLGLEFEGGDKGDDGSMNCLRLVFRQVWTFVFRFGGRGGTACAGQYRGVRCRCGLVYTAPVVAVPPTCV